MARKAWFLVAAMVLAACGGTIDSTAVDKGRAAQNAGQGDASAPAAASGANLTGCDPTSPSAAPTTLGATIAVYRGADGSVWVVDGDIHDGRVFYVHDGALVQLPVTRVEDNGPGPAPIYIFAGKITIWATENTGVPYAVDYNDGSSAHDSDLTLISSDTVAGERAVTCSAAVSPVIVGPPGADANNTGCDPSSAVAKPAPALGPTFEVYRGDDGSIYVLEPDMHSGRVFVADGNVLVLLLGDHQSTDPAGPAPLMIDAGQEPTLRSGFDRGALRGRTGPRRSRAELAFADEGHAGRRRGVPRGHVPLRRPLVLKS